MPTTVFLSLRGDDASRALENFRRALGEDAQSLVVVPTNDESGFHGSAEVGDVAAAREAFALARKPYPNLRAYLGAGGRDDPPMRPPVGNNGESQGRRGGEGRGRSGARPAEGRGESRNRTAEQRGRGPENRENRAQERDREKDPAAEAEARETRRANPRRHRGGRRPQGGEPREPQG